MQEFIQDDLTFFALPFFFAAIALEAYWSHKNAMGWYRGSDTVASLSMMVLAAVVEFAPVTGQRGQRLSHFCVLR